MRITFRDIDDAILSGYTVTYVTACATTILRRDKTIAALSMKVRSKLSQSRILLQTGTDRSRRRRRAMTFARSTFIAR